MKKIIINITLLVISFLMILPTEPKAETKKNIALTFDDGPCEYTEELIDILNKHNAKATFFLSGQQVSKYPNSIIKAVAYGNEIGIHTLTHQLFINMSIQEIKQEINQTKEELNKIGLSPSNLVRPPYGSINNNIVNNINTTFILWNVDSKDWLYTSKEKIKNSVKKDLENGAIILFHDSEKITLEVLDELLEELKKEYNFLTISELFKVNNQTKEINQKYYFIHH